MTIADLSTNIALLLPMILLAEGVIGLTVWLALGSRGGRGARIAAWFGFVTLTLWCGSAAAFVLLHLLLFTFGREAAVIGGAAITALMVLMPFAWAMVVRHHGRAS